jgi:DHA1 family bicyclomycin/chloramphenicol resistance-like MFS transporter
LSLEAGSSFRRATYIIILGALTAFGPLSIDLYLPALPALSHDLIAPEAQIQLTLTACLAGLALGQTVAGPASDTLGRRRPLMVGLAAYAVTSLLCAAAPSAAALILFRLLQGFAGAFGLVIARAVVRDLYAGAAAARFFSRLMLVSGLAPMLAPGLGGQLLRITSWRGLFVLLALVSAVLLVAASLGLRETLSRDRRRSGGLGDTLRSFGRLATDRAFVGYAGANGLAFASLFAYISASPFVLQEMYGVSPQLFGIFFGINALGIVVAGQVSARLVGRISPHRLLIGGLTAIALGGLALLIVVATGRLGLAGILPALFVCVASIGLVIPNGTALALTNHPRAAGTASALLGVLQFAFGAIVAPLVGVGGSHTALPMAIVMAALGVGGLAGLLALVGYGRNTPDTSRGGYHRSRLR